jgi:hypothetical protein
MELPRDSGGGGVLLMTEPGSCQIATIAPDQVLLIRQGRELCHGSIARLRHETRWMRINNVPTHMFLYMLQSRACLSIRAFDPSISGFRTPTATNYPATNPTSHQRTLVKGITKFVPCTSPSRLVPHLIQALMTLRQFAAVWVPFVCALNLKRAHILLTVTPLVAQFRASEMLGDECRAHSDRDTPLWSNYFVECGYSATCRRRTSSTPAKTGDVLCIANFCEAACFLLVKPPDLDTVCTSKPTLYFYAAQKRQYLFSPFPSLPFTSHQVLARSPSQTHSPSTPSRNPRRRKRCAYRLSAP